MGGEREGEKAEEGRGRQKGLSHYFQAYLFIHDHPLEAGVYSDEALAGVPEGEKKKLLAKKKKEDAAKTKEFEEKKAAMSKRGKKKSQFFCFREKNGGRQGRRRRETRRMEEGRQGVGGGRGMKKGQRDEIFKNF
jgi:hypothetical protein